MLEQRLLVVRLGSLGDIVHTFPAVAGLRESYPDAEIVWLAHPRWKPLVESSGLATDIWETETRSYRSLREIIGRIRKNQFTAAIDYQGLWKSAALPFLGRVSRRVGFSSQTIREFGVPILYTDRVRCTQTHIADQNGELSQRAGARNGVAPVVLTLPSIQEAFVLQLLRGSGIERYVVLSPAGGWRSKCWPPDRYGALCQRIHGDLGLRCVLNHGPGEEQLVSTIKAASGKANPLAYNGSLGQLMALLRNAVCIVGGDTGPLHLAVALGTPAVAIFGPTDPARNGPYRTGDRSAAASPLDTVLRSPHAVTTYKRDDQAAPSILEIDVDTVFDAVRGQLEVHR
jgi:ADP-heptose:LPS heptosyltransferase